MIARAGIEATAGQASGLAADPDHQVVGTPRSASSTHLVGDVAHGEVRVTVGPVPGEVVRQAARHLAEAADPEEVAPRRDEAVEHGGREEL
eukprot:12601801-Alexandrium_andersonii.AAC.1